MKTLKPHKVFALAAVAALLVAALLTASAPNNAHAAGSSAQSMMLMEANSGRVIYSQNAHARLPMASTTKVVTAIVVIESCALDTVVKVPAQAVGVEGSSIYLQKDEPLTVKDLLYGLMLQSGNDCAVALAIHAGGSVQGFASMMNGLAKRIGCTGSNFVNPHGLHHKEHYTSAADLCRISCYAMRNKVFREIVATKQYKAPWQGREYPRIINNKNKILWQYEGGNGIKTGFTKAAGRCLVAASERNGMQLVCVVLNCGPMFPECMRLMDAAHAAYAMEEVCAEGRVCGSVPAVDGKPEAVTAVTARSRSYPVTRDELLRLSYSSELPACINAPVEAGAPLGRLNVTLDGRVIVSEDIYAAESVRALTLDDKIGDLINEW